MKIKKLKKIKIGENTKVFLIFFVISFVLWFFNALNQEYTTELIVPVRYINFPKNKINTQPLPSKIIATVRANGNDLFKYQLKKRFKPLEIDLSAAKYERITSNDTDDFYILTDAFVKQLDAQMQGKIQVEMLKPDTLFFHFSRMVLKNVPVVAKVVIKPKSQYILKGKIRVNPNIIAVKGPLSIIDTLTAVYTMPKVYKNVDKNIEDVIKLKQIDGVSFARNDVEISAEIEQFTEVSFKIPIKTVNVPDSVILHLFPNYVTMNCQVGLSHYKDVKDTDFEVVVDFNSLLDNMGSKLPTRVVKSSPYVYHFYQTPEFVEYVIENKTK